MMYIYPFETSGDKTMVLSTFIFGNDIPVEVASWGEDQRSVTLIPSQNLMTPCGTLSFTKGRKVFFGKVTVEGVTIRPESGTLIDYVG